MATRKTAKKTATKTTKKTDISIGDIIELKNDHHCMCADFPKGSKVLVTGLSERGYSLNNNPENPEEGFEMTECGFEL